MLYIGGVEIPGSDDHEGYVAGLTADGTYTGIWTDVRLPGTPELVAYAPACECGWHGPAHPADRSGFRAAARAWVTDHFAGLGSVRPVVARLGRPLCPESEFLTAPDPVGDLALA